MDVVFIRTADEREVGVAVHLIVSVFIRHNVDVFVVRRRVERKESALAYLPQDSEVENLIHSLKKLRTSHYI